MNEPVIRQGSQWCTVGASLTHCNRNSSPSSLWCAWSWPSKLASEGCVYSLKLRTMRQLGSPLSETGTTQHGCDLGNSAMLSAQLYTLQFQAHWSSGSENYNINCYEKKLKITRKKSFTDCYSKGLVESKIMLNSFHQSKKFTRCFVTGIIFLFT